MSSNQHPQINWRSRIVKTGKILASQVTPHPQNPRRHPQLQRDAVAASFDRLGQIAPIIININNGYLVDGEERSWLALAQKQDVELDVDYVDLTEDEHLLALTIFDPISNLATYDTAQLDALLRDVQTDSPALDKMLSDLAVKTGVIPPDDPYAEWVGMPEFEQDDKEPYRTIHIHFKNKADVEDFARLVKQVITEKTRFLWFPYIEIERYSDKRYSDES